MAATQLHKELHFKVGTEKNGVFFADWG